MVIVADTMAVTMLPDPAATPLAGSWAPTFPTWNAWAPLPLANPGEFVFGGAYLDSSDVLYVVDKRNRALRAVKLTATSPGFSELRNSPYYWPKNVTFTFSETVSMLLVPSSDGLDTLWLPLAGSLQGVAGFAIVFPTAYFTDSTVTPFIAPLPNAECGWPEDLGSVVLAPSRATNYQSAVLVLSSTECGAVALTSNVGARTVAKVYDMEPYSYNFAQEGEHAHPVYDAGSHALLWFDYSIRPGMPQQLCCANATNFNSCSGWRGECFNLPMLAFDPDSETFSPWMWLTMSLAGGNIYIAASGYITFQGDTHGAIFVYGLATGALVSKYRTESDMFNSAPLAVVPDVGEPRIYVTSTLGGLYCFSASTMAGGPLWVTRGEVGAIPGEDLPQSTYSYLTLTPRGTLLVTASAGGADWSDEKVVYAIVNGVQVPPASAGSGSPSNTGGIVAAVLLGLAGAAGVFSYFKVPAFRAGVDAGVSTARAGVAKMAGGYKSVGASSGGGSGLSASFGSGGSSGGAPAFTSGGGYGGV